MTYGAIYDSGWPPNNIPLMVQEMRRNPSSQHWAQLRHTVNGMASRYGHRASTYLDDADDITQECLAIICTPGKLDAFVAKAALVPPAQVRPMFLGWLYVITKRVWIARKRYADRRPQIAAPPQRESPDETDALTDIPAPASSPDEIVLMSDWLKTIFKRLDTLATRGDWEASKVALLLSKALDGISYKDIADQYHLKESQVRDAIRNIREQLERLRQQYDGEPTPSNGGRKDQRPPGQRTPRRTKRPTVSPPPATSPRGQRRQRPRLLNEEAQEHSDADQNAIQGKGDTLQ
ncbi:MAG TPA: RNA polymerase sigma factor [Ktedonobacterales bacterium]|jgi:DNA-directed RNA polymerase specialized sigma24 family protein